MSTMTRIGADLPTRMRIVPFSPSRTGLVTVRTGIETVGVSRAALEAERSTSVSAAVADDEITSAPAATATPSRVRGKRRGTRRGKHGFAGRERFAGLYPCWHGRLIRQQHLSILTNLGWRGLGCVTLDLATIR